MGSTHIYIPANIKFSLCQLGIGTNGDEDGYILWQSLVRQTELTAQLCSITRDVRNVRGGTQKKIEKLRHLLSGLLSELTYFDEVTLVVQFCFFFNVSCNTLFYIKSIYKCVIVYKNEPKYS